MHFACMLIYRYINNTPVSSHEILGVMGEKIHSDRQRLGMQGHTNVIAFPLLFLNHYVSAAMEDIHLH